MGCEAMEWIEGCHAEKASSKYEYQFQFSYVHHSTPSSFPKRRNEKRTKTPPTSFAVTG
jgi:hypothetical protein